MKNLVTVSSGEVVHLGWINIFPLYFVPLPPTSELFTYNSKEGKHSYSWRAWLSTLAVLCWSLNRRCEHWNWLQAVPNLFTSALHCSLVSQKRSQGYCSEVVDQIRKFPVAVVLIFKLVPFVLSCFPLPHRQTQLMIYLLLGIQYLYPI